MKSNRILSALLCLCMVFVLLPSVALADDPPPGLFVAGELVDTSTSGFITVTTGSGSIAREVTGKGNGTVYYDAPTKTLTLDGVAITAPNEDGDVYSGIYNNADSLTIHLVGNNSIRKTVGGLYHNAIFTMKQLTITADPDASLSLTANSGTVGNFGISTKSDLTIEGGNISTANIEDGNESYGIRVDGGRLTINGGSLTAVAGNSAENPTAFFAMGTKILRRKTRTTAISPSKTPLCSPEAARRKTAAVLCQNTI